MASQVENIKWIPGTRFLVDGFRFQSPECTAYFLTHCHSDHTTGLTKRFEGGLIYGTPVTCRILQHNMGLPPQILRPIELNKPAVIEGVDVVALDANHCPGACMFLFKVHAASSTSRKSQQPPTQQQQQQDSTNKKVILHTGDFRWNSNLHGNCPILSSLKIDTLFLDTTYCAPKWTFPEQDTVIQDMADMMRKEIESEPTTLFVVGSYHIGKERAYLGAAHILGFKVFAPPGKQRLLRLLGLPAEWMALLVDAPEAASLHVLSMFNEQMHEQALADKIKDTQWKRIVAIRPTGWTYRKKGGFTTSVHGVVTIVGVPYSEHSSFAELQDCVRTLRPKKLVPTVNAGDVGKSKALVNRLAGLMDLSEDRSRLDSYFGGNNGGGSGNGGGGIVKKRKTLEYSVDDDDDHDDDVVVVDGEEEQEVLDLLDDGEDDAEEIEIIPPPPPQQNQQQQQQQQQTENVHIARTPHITTPANNTRYPVEEEVVVDISAVDIAEQQRILEAIAAAAMKRSTTGSGNSAQKLKQGSIKSFFGGDGTPGNVDRQ